jgi:hypothetical protein
VPQFEYQLLRTSKISSGLRLSIHPEKGVIVRAPFWVPETLVRKFVEAKSAWVEKHLKKLQARTAPAKQYLAGEKHLYFGQEYLLTITEASAPQRTTAQISADQLQVTLFDGHTGAQRINEIQDAILRLYLETGIAVITEKVNHFTTQLGVEYSRIDIKKVSSIWGSCSPSNRLCFNRKLIMAPPEVVEYVVIHEVCHLVQRNHSSRFWALVARFDPEFREHRRWLHRHHLLLSL